MQLGCANIQARNTTTGDVPLHDAASHGHKEVVKELLSLNAPANPRNNENLVPAQLARANNFIECAEILGEYIKFVFCTVSKKPVANKYLYTSFYLTNTICISIANQNRIKYTPKN